MSQIKKWKLDPFSSVAAIMECPIEEDLKLPECGHLAGNIIDPWVLRIYCSKGVAYMEVCSFQCSIKEVERC